ncbi:MAG: ABC transporter substrate-binding protein [bacterium]
MSPRAAWRALGARLRGLRSRRLGIALACGSLVVASACNRGSPPAKGAGAPSTLVIGLDSDPTNLDPRLATDAASSRILDLVCEGLVRLAGDGSPRPALAASWDVTEDRNYVFHLASGVTFSDGSPLSAADVKATLEAVLDPAFASPHRAALARIRSIDTPDPATVAIRLDEPYAPLLTALSVGILPAAKVADHTQKYARGATCTGPYQVRSFAAGDRVVVEANPHFRGAAPAIERIELKILTDEATRALELRKGSVQFLLNGVAPDRIADLEGDPALAIVRTASANTTYLGFNLTDPLLSDVRVRRAIAQAIDRDGIIRSLLGGHALPATGLLPPSSWAYAGDVARQPYDPAAAKRLLDEAGKPDADGDGPALRFTLVHKTSEDKLRRRIAEVLQSQLAAVGVGLTIQSSEWGTFFDDIKRGNFQTFTLQWVGVTEPDMFWTVFHSANVPPAGANRGRFHDARVDELSERAHTLLDPAARKPLYAEIQRLVADELPYVFLWHEEHIAVMSKRLEGFELDPRGSFDSFARARWAGG